MRLKFSSGWLPRQETLFTSIFAHQQFSLTLIFAPLIFAQLLHFRAPSIFAQWYLIHFSFSILLERVIYAGNRHWYIRKAVIASLPGLSCVLYVISGPYLVGPINFRATKMEHIFAPTNFRAALRENKWCAKFEVSKVLWLFVFAEEETIASDS